MVDCPICLDKIKGKGYITFCNHPFHSECINKHLDRDIRCPICRRIFLNTDGRKLYVNRVQDEFGFKMTELIDVDGYIVSSIPLWIM